MNNNNLNQNNINLDNSITYNKQFQGNYHYNVSENNSVKKFTNKNDNKKIILTVLLITILIVIVLVIGIVLYKGDFLSNIGGGTDVKKLNIGDYVDYIPETANAYPKLESKYSGNGLDNKSISQEKLNWQILRIYDDGSIDLIGSQTKTSVFLGRAQGYNNGVFLLNDICEQLYSNKSKGIVARSVNIDDIEYWLSENGKKERDSFKSSGVKYGESITPVLAGNKYYPDIYQYETEMGVSDTYDGYYDGLTTNQFNTVGSERLTVKQTYYFFDVKEENFGEGIKALEIKEGDAYWVASRYVAYSEGYAYFGLRAVDSKFWGFLLADSTGEYYLAPGLKLRPIVTLNSSVKIKKSKGENSLTNPHKIIEY